MLKKRNKGIAREEVIEETPRIDVFFYHLGVDQRTKWINYIKKGKRE